MHVVESLRQAADGKGGAEDESEKAAGSDPADNTAGHGSILFHDPPSYFAENKSGISDAGR